MAKKPPKGCQVAIISVRVLFETVRHILSKNFDSHSYFLQPDFSFSQKTIEAQMRNTASFLSAEIDLMLKNMMELTE